MDGDRLSKFRYLASGHQEIMLLKSNNLTHLVNGSNAVGNKPANQMTHVSLNTDSDSSSSDQIQLQMRRNLTKHRRKRYCIFYE